MEKKRIFWVDPLELWLQFPDYVDVQALVASGKIKPFESELQYHSVEPYVLVYNESVL